VIVIENGQIVEQGTHDELMAAEGAYHRLTMSQFRDQWDDSSGAAAGGR